MKGTIVLLIILASIQLDAQDNKPEIYSTQMNNSIDGELFFNTKFIDDLLKDKRIILLGELDHGDGTSMEIKSKVIKYLHEKHNFNLLVFESGLINCNALWTSTKEGNFIAQNASDHIYPIWSEVKETEKLFQYIDRQNQLGRTLQTVGIDPQFSGKRNEKVFIELLKTKLSSSEIENKRFDEFSYELGIVSQWMKYPDKDKHRITESTFNAHIEYYKKKVLPKVDSSEKELWNLYFENIQTLATIKWERREGSFELRDWQMFRNLTFWLNKYSHEKVIVWAANAHIIRNDIHLSGRHSDHKLIGIKKLGDHIFSAYPDDTYSIAFTARSGRTLNFLNKKKTNKIGKHKGFSLEETLKKSDFAFIDLASFENTFGLNEYESQLFYPNVKCTSKWSKHFNGVIFIHQMKPSTPTW